MIQTEAPRLRFLLFLPLLLSAAAAARAGVAITEIHYHPPPGDEALEFVEITNGSATPVDLSGYAFVEGITFTFPAGTVLEGRGILVLGLDAAALKTRYGITNAIGNFTGRLDNGGERITLANHSGIAVQSLQYNDSGKWPVGPDGTGHTLVLRNVHLDSGEPESWMQSPQLGGTPGAPNFPDGGPRTEERALVDRRQEWRYQKGTGPFSAPAAAWLDPAFDDAGWARGLSGFGFGDSDDETVLADMQGGYTSLACRKRFTLTDADLEGEGQFSLAVDFDDGFCAFLNGTEVARVNCGAAGQVPVFDAVASGSREAGSESVFAINRNLLRRGENVLCVAGYNISLDSTDFSLIPRLVLLQTISGGSEVVETELVGGGENWRFRRGTSAFSVPAAAWRSPGFDDRAWEEGAAGFGFRLAGDAAIAYLVAAGTAGNQDFGGPLGMDFDVVEDLEVTRLGVFDSGADGLAAPLSASLYDRATQEKLATLQFTPQSPGQLIGGSRFKPLAEALTLPAGFQGAIVAEGYGAAEMNGNQGSFPLDLSLDDGGGAIVFTGGGRFGDAGAAGTFPTQVDGGPANRYAAGTFEFRPAGAAAGEPVAPPGVGTLLADMKGAYTSIATRRVFNLGAEEVDADGEYYLAVDFDDGFCAFLNGAEIARVNCGAAGEEPLAGGMASAAHPGGQEQVFAVSRDLFVAGDNLLAVAGYSTGLDDTAMNLTARLFRRQVISQGTAGTVVLNELCRPGTAPRSGWVEIHNRGTSAADLSGFTLSGEVEEPGAPHLFPAGTVLGPGKLLVVTEAASPLDLSGERVQLFLGDPAGLVAAASTFDRAAPAGAAPGSWSELRFPDGGSLDWVSLTPTPGAANIAERVDSIVINEVFYHPPGDRADQEFLELHNRGPSEVDLSGWYFDKGLQYVIPEGTRMAAGSYLVIAKDPAVIARIYSVQALGPYEGVLSNKGESVQLVDRSGNPRSGLRYFGGGAWSPWADGGGSSLELIDPDQDHSSPSAWDASDESEKAPWELLSFRVPAYVPAAESELHFYLAKIGECLIDDVAIRRNGGANLIPNPGFEASTTPWIIEGTHGSSGRTTADSHSGSAALQVIATGKGDTTVNRIETDTSPAMTAGPYDVSLWARWQRGSTLLVVHGEYSAGPFRTAPCFTCGVPEPNLSGNPLSAALRLTVPPDLGTPGRENSVTRRLREETGARNLGPVIDSVVHRPPSPGPGEPVLVTARVSDRQGTASVRVHYRIGSAAGVFESAPLFDDGLNGDGAAGDGVFGGQISGFPLLTRVVFYLEATDVLGAARRFPVEAPERTCLYLVQGPLTDRLDRYNIVLDTQRTAELQTRTLHSNDRVEGTFFFDNERAYYHVGVRYRGSPWGRPSRLSYRVRFPEDDLFHDRQQAINISKTGGNPNEGAALFLIGRNATSGKPSPAADYQWVRTWFNGGALGAKGLIEVIDATFVEKWYGEDSEGPLLKAFGRFVFNDGGGLSGQQGWEGASLIYRGDQSENYRGYYVQSMNRDEDNWEPLFDLTRLLDPGTPNAELDAGVAGIVDLEPFLRGQAGRVLVGDGDAFGVNNGHNGYLVYDSLKGGWGILAFDAEASFWSGTPNLFNSADPAMTRLLSRPEPRRVYLRSLWEFTNGYWTATVPKPYFDALQRATGYGTSGILSFISSSATGVKSTLQPFLTPKLRILTNGGNEITTDQPEVDLQGEAPVSIDALLAASGGADLATFPQTWSSPVRWEARFALRPGPNEIRFLGFDSRGNLLGSTQITVVYRPGGFLRGDATGDYQINISDPLQVLFHLYGGASLSCADAADFEDNGSLEIADAIGVLQYLFLAGPTPAGPFPDPGPDVKDDALPDCVLP